MEQQTKKCPYCGELISAEAKKCRYCGEWLTEESPMVEKPSTAASVVASDHSNNSNSNMLFGKIVSRNTIMLLAIIAIISSLMPTSDVWEDLPDNWILLGGITGTIAKTVSYIYFACLEIPMWIPALFMGLSLAALIIILANKVGKFDNRNKVILYIVGAGFVVLAFMISVLYSDPALGASLDDIDDEGTAAVAGLVSLALIIAFLAFFALMLYSGIRFNSYPSRKYKTLGIYLIAFSIASLLLIIIETQVTEYSIAAKVVNLRETGLYCVLVYFITACLIRLKKKNILLNTITYGMIIVSFFVLIYAIDVSFDDSTAGITTHDSEMLAYQESEGQALLCQDT